MKVIPCIQTIPHNVFICSQLQRLECAHACELTWKNSVSVSNFEHLLGTLYNPSTCTISHPLSVVHQWPWIGTRVHAIGSLHTCTTHDPHHQTVLQSIRSLYPRTPPINGQLLGSSLSLQLHPPRQQPDRWLQWRKHPRHLSPFFQGVVAWYNLMSTEAASCIGFR